MYRNVSSECNAISIGPWCWAGVVGLCLALTGCTAFDIRGDKFREDDFSTMGRRLRTPDRYNQPWGVSNKALQIEKDLGVE